MILPDIDIDLAPGHRQKLLEHIRHVPASLKDNSKHLSGIYVTAIPANISGNANINYVEAEKLSYFKIDLLTNSVYGLIRDQDHYDELLNKEPDWDLLLDSDFVKNLSHLSNYHNILYQMRPKSYEELAMVLAIIRPGKKHLIGKSWEEISKTVWEATEEYSFRKSHAISYAVMIGIHINLLAG